MDQYSEYQPIKGITVRVLAPGSEKQQLILVRNPKQTPPAPLGKTPMVRSSTPQPSQMSFDEDSYDEIEDPFSDLVEEDSEQELTLGMYNDFPIPFFCN